MSIVSQLVGLAQPWADVYNESTTLQASVMFAHLAGVLVSGGAAVVTDRATITAASRSSADRLQQLGALRASHRMILMGLGVTCVSGVLLLGGDIESLVTAPAFLVKMGLLIMLLANGVLLMRAESGPSLVAVSTTTVVTAPAEDASTWRRLTVLSYVSLVLWFALLLASTFLVTSA